MPALGISIAAIMLIHKIIEIPEPVNQVRETLYKVLLGPCRHYAGTRGDPEWLMGKHVKCPSPECSGSPPRRIIQIIKPIPGR